MWAPYYQGGRSKLPHAKVVVDRFHVMKQLNSRLTQLRTNYQKQCSPEIQKVLKGSQWILDFVEKESIDMMVMCRKGGGSHFNMGGVAQKVVSNSPVPVVITQNKQGE